MSRLKFASLFIGAFSLSAVQPALAAGCCPGIPAEPKVIYAAPPQYDAGPPAEIPNFKVNQGPYITGLDLDAEGYPPTYFYPAQPPRSYPYLHGDDFRYAAWPAYDPMVYRAYPNPRYMPTRPKRHWSQRGPRVWK